MNKGNNIEQLKRKFEANISLYDETKSNVGKKLCSIRKKIGYTQKDIADIVGITRATLSNYETGERTIDIDILYKLCSLYGVSIDYLVGIKDTPTPDRSYDEVEEYKSLGFSDESLSKLFGCYDTVSLFNDIILHKDFDYLQHLNHLSRYTRYESMDTEYRSFLTSKLLYEMISDIYEQWYIDNDERIKTLNEKEKKDLLNSIKDYLQKKKESSDLLMFDFDSYEEKERQVEMLYKKLKEYF